MRVANHQATLEAFLRLYWLRPTTALWRAIESLSIHDVELRGPMLELGCGDGFASFVRAGGRFSAEFDAYLQPERTTAPTVEPELSSANVAAPRRVQAPQQRVSVGVDHSSILCAKARTTGLYDDVIVVDSGVPSFEAGRFASIYCNLLNWPADFPETLRDGATWLRTDGKMVVQVPSETFRQYSALEQLRQTAFATGWHALLKLDRGRTQLAYYCRTFEEWRELFEACGLEIVQHRRYLSKPVLQAWDIGLTPVLPYLVEMASKLTATDRGEIKQKWVMGLRELLGPLCRLDWPTDTDSPPGMYMFVLQRR